MSKPSSYNLNPVDVIVSLDDAQALALAQFVKRITWSAMRECAVDDKETNDIAGALEELRVALRDKGYAPR